MKFAEGAVSLSLFCVTLLSLFTSCSSGIKYESIEELDDGVWLQWGDRIYSFHSALPDESFRGAQIAIVNHDRKDKIFSVNGYGKDEWIIEYYSYGMSVYSLYKSDAVTEIPSAFEQD